MRRFVWWIVAIAAIAAVAALVLRSPTEPDYSRIDIQTTDDLERELEAFRQRLQIPGLSAAIADDGKVVWSRGFGYANLERRVPVDPDTTSFHLASVTKPYTATVVLQLVDEGRLDLESPVSAFGVEMPGDEPVRVWHLLSHTARPTPGRVYAYDPRTFGKLTQVVERASGRPFAAEVADRIVRRLGLQHTGPNPRDVDWQACRTQLSSRALGLCGTQQQAERARMVFATSGLDRGSIDADLATGYARQWGRQLWPAGLSGPMRPEQHLTELFASAGLVASAGDVLRFSNALDEGGLLKSTTLERMYRPALNRADIGPTFGLGWFLQEYQGMHLAWHFGQAFESSSLLIKIPAHRVSFVALANSDGLSRRRKLGDHGDVLQSPVARLFLKWYSSKR